MERTKSILSFLRLTLPRDLKRPSHLVLGFFDNFRTFIQQLVLHDDRYHPFLFFLERGMAKVHESRLTECTARIHLIL